MGHLARMQTSCLQLFHVCSRRDKPLALYIFSNDKSKVQRMMESTSSGGFLANDTVVHAAGKWAIFYLAEWAGLERGSVISFWALGKGWVVQISATLGGGLPCFGAGIGTHLTQSTTEVTTSSSKGRQTFQVVAEKVYLGGVQQRWPLHVL